MARLPGKTGMQYDFKRRNNFQMNYNDVISLGWQMNAVKLVKSKDRYPDGLVSNYNVLHELKDKIQSFSLSEKGTGIPPLR